MDLIFLQVMIPVMVLVMILDIVLIMVQVIVQVMVPVMGLPMFMVHSTSIQNIFVKFRYSAKFDIY